MAGLIFDDLRRMVLGLLFLVAFGWMAAQVLPGAPDGGGGILMAAVAASDHVIPPRP